MPSRLVAPPGRRGLVKLPPVVLLVRRIPDSLLSYFFKCGRPKALGPLDRYLARPPQAQGSTSVVHSASSTAGACFGRCFPSA